jgi:hypothetical protein
MFAAESVTRKLVIIMAVRACEWVVVVARPCLKTGQGQEVIRSTLLRIKSVWQIDSFMKGGVHEGM